MVFDFPSERRRA